MNEELRLKAIGLKARTAREYFDGHEAKADEVTDRIYLEEIEFLLSIISKLSRRKL